MTTSLEVRPRCKGCGEWLEARGVCSGCGGRAFVHHVNALTGDNGLTSYQRVEGCPAARCGGGHVIDQGPRPEEKS